MRRLWRDRSAGVGVLIAAGMPLVIGAGALAVDLGSIQLETRRLQGVADAAAVAAAIDPINAQARATGSVTLSAFPHAVTSVATAGSYAADPSIAPANRFTPGGSNLDAAKVTVTSRSPTFLSRIFGMTGIEISRTATAQRQRVGAFSIGSRLASLNGGIVNAYLSALTGSNISLNVMDYNALAGADVDLLSYLPMLRTQVGANALTFNDVLNTSVTAPQALSALANTLNASGATALGATVQSLANSVSGTNTIKLGTLVDLGPIGKQGSGGTGVVRVNVMQMVTTLLQLSSNQRQVSLDLGATLPGFASTKLSIAVGQRPTQSPWIGVGDTGKVTVRTAQTRVYLDVKLTPTAIVGIPGLADVRVPVFVELASAEGRVSNVTCPTATTRSVSLEARTNPGLAAIGTVDTSTLGDFTQPVVTQRVNVVDTLLLDVASHTTANLGAVEPWQALTFNQAQIAAGSIQTVQSSTMVGGVAASLLSRPNLTVYVAGIPLPLSPLIAPVGAVLSAAATPIDQLLTLVTGTLGVGVGQADLRVTGVRCGMAVLVA